MEIVRIDVDRKDFEVVLFGDTHYGSTNTHHKLIKKMIRDIKDGNKLALNLGDNIEAITPSDKRFSSTTIDKTAMTTGDQRDKWIKDFMPIKDNIKAIGIGNHEHKIINTINIGKEISDAFGCAFGGLMYTAHFYYKKKLLFKFLIVHGSGTMVRGAKDPIQREGNQKAWLKMKLDRTGISDCIVMAMGHTHQLIRQKPTVDDEILLSSCEKELHQHTRPTQKQNLSFIAPDRRWYVNTGSFLKLYSDPGSLVFGYAEARMLPPTRLGWAEVQVRDGEVVDVIKKEDDK